MKKIEIYDIEQKQINDIYVYIYKLRIDNKEYELKYNISLTEDCVSFPIPERIDSIVVSLLIHAMTYGYDFSSNYPISQKLFYQLTYHVIPQMLKCNANLSKINIDAPLTKEQFNGKNVATGISCGIDSLTTIYEYTDLCKIDDYKLTHLVYFKTGAHDGQIGKFDEKIESDLFKEQVVNAINFSKSVKLPLIIVETNLNEVLSNAFEFTNYDRTHAIRNSGTMMLLQKDFSKYYYSDTYSLDNFFIDTTKDIAHYEKWLLPMISNENISIYSSNQNMTRFEKTKLITNYSPSYDNLLVCWHNGKNCGKCDKCIRTMISLDFVGKLDLYKNSFDIEEYKKNRIDYIEKVILMREYDPFFEDIYSHVKNDLLNQLDKKRKFKIRLKLFKRKIKKLFKKN